MKDTKRTKDAKIKIEIKIHQFISGPFIFGNYRFQLFQLLRPRHQSKLRKILISTFMDFLRVLPLSAAAAAKTVEVQQSFFLPFGRLLSVAAASEVKTSKQTLPLKSCNLMSYLYYFHEYNLFFITGTFIFQKIGRCMFQYMFSFCNILSFGVRVRD